MHKPKIAGRILLIKILASLVGIVTTTPAQSHFSPDSLKKHVYLLGSDSLEGRAPGAAGSELAADYIATQLQESGLIPVGADNTYFQPIPMHGSIPLAESILRLYTDDMVYDFELGRDYLLYKTGSQTFLPQPASLVFAGYGIIAPEFDYNDYQAVEVSGKVVVFLNGEPYSNDPAYFDGAKPTLYSHAEVKHRLAISRGAVGSILIPLPGVSGVARDSSWEHWRQEFAFEDVTLAYSTTSQFSAVMNPSAAVRLFEGARLPPDELLESQAQISGFALPGKILFRGEFIEREFSGKNVVGMLEGSHEKLKDSYIIISAHYDHLGIGPPVQGDSIYNGVMDNAVGVAAVLEIARAFSESSPRPKRSIIFLFLTGEEKGLLGSIYYTDHPIKPLYKTVANINVDGLAMFDTFNDVVGVGAELSSLGEMLAELCAEQGLAISPIPTEFSASESYFRSDQIAFARAGIPSILIMEGLNYRNLSADEGRRRQIEWLEDYYHTPFDDLNQPLNFDAAAQHFDLLFGFCRYVADREEEPQWKPGIPFTNARLQTIAEQR